MIFKMHAFLPSFRLPRLLPLSVGKLSLGKICYPQYDVVAPGVAWERGAGAVLQRRA